MDSRSSPVMRNDASQPAATGDTAGWPPDVPS